MAQPIQDSVTGFPVSLSASAIDRALAGMWEKRSESAPVEGAEEAAVARITLGNMIWIGTTRHAPRIRQIFSQLVPKYPCRLFLLEVLDDHDDADINAYVNAYCFLAKGIRREVCCEEIHLRFGPNALPHVTGAVLPLLVADVPTFLWYFSSNPEFYGEALPGLSKVADRTFTELAFLDNPAQGLRDMAEGRNQAISLSWYRLHPLREQIAAVFDDERYGRLLGEIDRVHIGWAGACRDPQSIVNASFLAGWLASRLGWRVKEPVTAWPFRYEGPRGEVCVEFSCQQALHTRDAAQIVRVEIHCLSGECIVLQMGDEIGQMERLIKAPCGTCRETPRYVHALAFDEAQALGHAMNARLDSNVHREAAAMTWPLLESALNRKVSE